MRVLRKCSAEVTHLLLKVACRESSSQHLNSTSSVYAHCYFNTLNSIVRNVYSCACYTDSKDPVWNFTRKNIEKGDLAFISVNTWAVSSLENGV